MASHVYKMGVHKMIEVESMANWTENVPKYLVWTPKNILRASFWAGVFPYALFKFTLPFYNQTAEINHRPPVDYARGLDVFTEYGTAGGTRVKSRYTSLK